MNCLWNVLFVSFVASVLSQKSADATVYEIPEACRRYQDILIKGSTMNGSTFIFANARNHTTVFVFNAYQYNPNATVRFDNETNTTDLYHYLKKTVNKTSMRFSLTGSWGDSDKMSVYYHAVDGNESCYDRNATNLRVRAAYDVQDVKGKNLSIWARDDCGVRVTLDGLVTSDKCSATLDFGDKGKFSARKPNVTLTTANGPITFNISSDCSSADVLLYYQENCPLTTTESTTESTVSTSPTTTMNSESTVSKSPSSGLKVVAHALPITFALILSMVHWL